MAMTSNPLLQRADNLLYQAHSSIRHLPALARALTEHLRLHQQAMAEAAEIVHSAQRINRDINALRCQVAQQRGYRHYDFGTDAAGDCGPNTGRYVILDGQACPAQPATSEVFSSRVAARRAAGADLANPPIILGIRQPYDAIAPGNIAWILYHAAGRQTLVKHCKIASEHLLAAQNVVKHSPSLHPDYRLWLLQAANDVARINHRLRSSSLRQSDAVPTPPEIPDPDPELIRFVNTPGVDQSVINVAARLVEAAQRHTAARLTYNPSNDSLEFCLRLKDDTPSCPTCTPTAASVSPATDRKAEACSNRPQAGVTPPPPTCCASCGDNKTRAAPVSFNGKTPSFEIGDFCSI